METCKYVHYEVDALTAKVRELEPSGQSLVSRDAEATILYPPQWIQCDLRSLDMSLLGKIYWSPIQV